MGIPNPPEQPTTIYAQITFRHISELSAQSQTIYADFWIQLAWVDPSVNYSEPFDSTRHFFPSITLPTARRSDAYQEPAWQIAYGYPSFPAPPPGAPGPSAMWVTASGTAAGIMANRMRMYDWPQDVQSVGVEIELLSWTVEYARFEMWPSADAFIYDPDFAVSEWRLKGGHIESYDHYYRNLDRTVDRVKATVVLQRESSWFMNKAVLNVVLLVLLALMAASMRPMTPDRFAIAISVFMAIVSWVFVLSADSPRTGENTRMDSFINVSFATVFLLAGFSALNYLWKEFATKQASKRKLLQSPAAMSALDALTGLSRRFPPGPGGGGGGGGGCGSGGSGSHTPMPLSNAPSQVWAAGPAHGPYGASRLQQQQQQPQQYGSALASEAAGPTAGPDGFGASSSSARGGRGAKRLTLSSLAAAAAAHAAAVGSAGSNGAGAAAGGGTGRRTVRGSLVAPPLTSIAQVQALQGHPHTPTQAQQAQAQQALAIATGNPLAALPPGAAPRPSPTAGGSGFSGFGGLSASPAAGHASLTRNTSFAARAAFPATQPSRRGDGRAGSGSKGSGVGAVAGAAGVSGGGMLPLPEGCGGSADTPSSPYRAPQQPQQRGATEIELPPLSLPPPSAPPQPRGSSAAGGAGSGTGTGAAAPGGGTDDADAATGLAGTHLGGLRASHIEAALANLAAVAAGAADGYGSGEGDGEAPGSPDFGDGGTGDDSEELQAELRSRHAAQVRAAAAAALSALRASIAAGGVSGGGGASFANPLASPLPGAGGHVVHPGRHSGEGASNAGSFSDDGGDGDSHGRAHSPALLQDGGRTDAGAAAAAAGAAGADRRAASLPPVRVEILAAARGGAAAVGSNSAGGGGEAASGKRGRGDSSVAAVNPLHATAGHGSGSAGGSRANRGGRLPAGSRDGADAAAASPLRCGASCCATVAVRMWEVFCFVLWFLLACGWCCPRRYNGGRGPPSLLCCAAATGSRGPLRRPRGVAGRRSAADGGSCSDGEEEDEFVEPVADSTWGAALHSSSGSSSRNVSAARGFAGSAGVAAAAAGGAEAAALASEGYPYDENGDPVLRSMWSFRTDAGPLVAATPGTATPRGSAAASMAAPPGHAAGPTAAAARWQRLRAAGLGAPALAADGRRSGSAASTVSDRRTQAGAGGGGGLRRKESFVARALTEEVRCCGVHLSFLEEFKPRMLDKRVTLLVLLLYSSATALIFLRPVRVSTLD